MCHRSIVYSLKPVGLFLLLILPQLGDIHEQNQSHPSSGILEHGNLNTYNFIVI
jgi:hypothetical protein